MTVKNLFIYKILITHRTFIPSSLMDLVQMTAQYIYNSKRLMTIVTLVDLERSVTALHTTDESLSMYKTLTTHRTFIPSSLMDIVQMTAQYIYNSKRLMTIVTLVRLGEECDRSSYDC